LILKLTHHDQLFCRDLKWLPHLQVSAENSLMQWSNHFKVSMILSEFHLKQRVFLLKLSRLLCLWIKFLAYSLWRSAVIHHKSKWCCKNDSI
jgi:hypothetical protein